MIENLRKDVDFIIKKSIQAVLPDEAVIKALRNFSCEKGKIILVAAGKAAWQMAAAASSVLPHVDDGIVITKYGHIKGDIEGMIADYSEVIRIHPQLTAIYQGRGNAFKSIGNLESALADYQKYIDIIKAQGYDGDEYIEACIAELKEKLNR
jgi:tetratricopeptide (TPR) repeat protein